MLVIMLDILQHLLVGTCKKSKKQNKRQSGVKGRRKKQHFYLSECAPNDAELMSIRQFFLSHRNEL